VTTLGATLLVVLAVLRKVFFAAAVLLAVVFAVDWLVRTRRINPFNPVARFFRRSVAPLVAPIEARVVRAGGVPSSAPWWALAAVVVGGILVLQGLEYAVGMVSVMATAGRYGPAGIVRVLVSWLLGLVQIALLVRVIASWFRLSEYSRWIRWAVTLTEPILRPLRAIIPPFGMMDVTPLVAWFLLSLLQRAVL
jgi:YggT family protein